MALTVTSQMTDLLLSPGSPATLGNGDKPASVSAVALPNGTCAGVSIPTGNQGPTSGPTIGNLSGGSNSVTSTSRTDRHLHVWLRCQYPVRSAALGGVCINLGGGSGAIYSVDGVDKGYRAAWTHYVLNLDPGDRPSPINGTAPGGNITTMGFEMNVSATLGEDYIHALYHQNLRTATGAQGITIVGGTSVAVEKFKSAADVDTAFFGLLQDPSGVGKFLTIEGPITFGGSATLDTYITDSDVAILAKTFTAYTTSSSASAVATDFYRLTITDHVSHPTVIVGTNINISGISKAIPLITNITLAGGHASSAITLTGGSWSFCDPLNLHAKCTHINQAFNQCGTITPNGAVLTNPTFSNCNRITLTNGSDAITGGRTVKHATASGVAFVVTNSLAKITGGHSAENTGGIGHFVEITAAGTYNWDTVLAGYLGTPGSNLSPSSGDPSAAVLNSSGGLVTINKTGGSTPSVRNTAGSTTQVNAGVSVQYTVLDNATAAPIQNARVVLLAAAGGALAAGISVSITRSGSTATVTHGGHAFVNGDQVAISGCTQGQYNGLHTISNVTASTYDYAVLGAPVTPATGAPKATAVILSGLTNASGIIVNSAFPFGSNQPVTGFARKGTSPPTYVTGTLGGTITASGLAGTAFLVAG